MFKSESSDAKAFVLRAFDALFNKRDYKTVETLWSPNCVQHSALIAPGRAGLFDLIKSLSPSLRYENHLILAENDMLMLHGCFSGTGLRLIGSRPISFGWRTVSSWSIGT